MEYKYKNGVFLARMQPLHKAHLEIIKLALQECEIVTIVLGSANKKDMIRNPFKLQKRKDWLMLSLMEIVIDLDFSRINVFEIPDWSFENDKNETTTWGRYFYYNVVSRIESKKFTIYYSDEPTIIKSWFVGTEIENNITLRLLQRSTMFEGLSATKIRQAILDMNIDYLVKYLPTPVFKDLKYIQNYYQEVNDNPKDDFSMK